MTIERINQDFSIYDNCIFKECDLDNDCIFKILTDYLNNINFYSSRIIKINKLLLDHQYAVYYVMIISVDGKRNLYINKTIIDEFINNYNRKQKLNKILS